MKVQKKIKGKKFSIDLSIFSMRREEGEQKLSNRIIKEVIKLDQATEYELIFKIASNARLPRLLNPVYGMDREAYDVMTFTDRLSPTAFCYWLIGIFYKNRQLLSTFLASQKKISLSILKTKPDSILAELSKLDISCKSWWSISTRVHVTKELKREDTKAYLANLEDLFRLADVSPSVQRLQLISESSAIGVFLKNIGSRLAEYRSSGIQQAIDNGSIESCRYVPHYLDPERKVNLAFITAESHESVIDQYVSFKEIALELATTDKIPDYLIDKIRDLANLLDDDELKSVVTTHQESSEQVSNIVNLYTKGNYKEVVSEIDELLESEDEAIFGLIEIYSKSKIYLKQPHARDCLFDIMAADLSEILQCKQTTVEKIESLTKIFVKFKTERWAKSLAFHLLSILQETTEHSAIELARLDTIALGSGNTPKARYAAAGYQIIDPEQIELLPDYRAAKYFPTETQGIELDEADFPVKSDFLKLRAHAYLYANELINAVSFSVEQYQKNNLSFYHLPFTTLCERINDHSQNNDSERIMCLIALDIFGKEQSGRFEESKSELFEELLLLAGTHRVSNLYAEKVLTDNDIYFLHQICIPSQLDNLFQYKTNDEVVHERVAIIDLLTAKVARMKKQLEQERDNVLESLFVEKLRAKIESGKLFVDVQQITSQRKNVYSSLYAQAKSIPGGVVLEPLDGPSAVEISKDIFKINDNNIVAATEKTEILYTIYMTAVDDFALNENYGLDKYLSAEIRHIVFEAQLRACFEKTHLVTVQKNGEYIQNDYWITRYHYVNSGITSQIDAILREFSQKIDQILELTNEQFRVDIGQDSGYGIFDFKPYHRRLVHLSKIVESASDADIFFKDLIDYMWEISSDSAKRAQLLIANDLMGDINELISALEQSISDVKGDVAMMDLVQEIKNARSMFTNQIEVVVNWFKFVGDQSTENYERLGVVIEASVSSFESIYGHGNRNVAFTQAKSDLQLSYREARSLFIAIFTALENAYKYGAPNSSISIEHSVDSQKNIITIKNFVLDKSAKELKETITTQKSKWTPEHLQLNRLEGGTGLYKIFSILTNLSNGLTFDISAEQNEFIASMRLENEYFSDRRQSA